jgi:hypothetical protein
MWPFLEARGLGCKVSPCTKVLSLTAQHDGPTVCAGKLVARRGQLHKQLGVKIVVRRSADLNNCHVIFTELDVEI